MAIILELTDEQIKELEKRKGTDKPISDIVLQAIFARNSAEQKENKENKENKEKEDKNNEKKNDER